MNRIAFALSALAGLAAVAIDDAAAAERLTGDQLKTEYSGIRLYANTPSGRVVMHDYRADGTISGAVGSKGRDKDQDTGKWWVEGDTLCRAWTGWRDDKPDACFTVTVDGDKATWYRADGSIYRTWRVAKSGDGEPVTPFAERPLCKDVGGYSAYLEKTGKVCRLY